MATVLITGGTGVIGQALAQLLVEKGYQVIILTQNISRAPEAVPGITYAAWNVKEQTIDVEALRNADYLLHLAGEGIADKRWSRKRKKEIVDSRVTSSNFIVKVLNDLPNRVRTVVSASAIGWYGADKGTKAVPFIESDAPDPGFLGEACRLWEAAIDPVTASGRRLVKLRTGIVLTREGGALKEFVKPINFGVAAILGTGRQVISWIHMHDLCRMYLMAMENDSIKGSYNAVAPKPVTNKELTLKLAQKIKNRFYLPLYVPGFLLKLVIGEMSVEVLKSTTVSCERIRMSGFSFVFPSVESAIGDLFRKP